MDSPTLPALLSTCKRVSIVILLCILGFCLVQAQEVEQKVVYIVDSIPIINDPDEGNEIMQEDVADLTVLENPDSLKALGYPDYDKVILLFTKAYRSRPDSLRKIPTTAKMEQRAGVWMMNGKPYSGRFIDYYYSGRKQGEGYLQDGVVQGRRLMFHQNGNISNERYYNKAVREGKDKVYYQDGTLKQQGEFVNGKENGIWEMYYPNGKLKVRNMLNQGVSEEETSYYSNGKLRNHFIMKNGKLKIDDALSKLASYINKGNLNHQKGKYKQAIENYTEAIVLDSNYAESYFARGTSKLYNLDFEGAIADFDKTLELEPYMGEALANRAFTRIRRHQIGNGRIIGQNKEVTITASKESDDIGDDELKEVCADLTDAWALGARSEMTKDAIARYCKK